jgi:hypothetical protein
MQPTHNTPTPAEVTTTPAPTTGAHDETADTNAPLTVADILRGAALYLYRHGWHQGDMFARHDIPTPAACVQGAIRMAACGGVNVAYTIATTILVDDTIAHLATFLQDIHEHPWCCLDPVEYLADWNDDPTRTVEAVITALHGAAYAWDLFGGGAK